MICRLAWHDVEPTPDTITAVSLGGTYSIMRCRRCGETLLDTGR